jgi:outer membrane lipoprotein carrier protein
MKKKNLFLAVFFVSTTITFAQSYHSATPEQQKELMQNITATMEQMKTLRGDFVQKKTVSILAEEMLSEGTLLFKQPNKLCWEYTKPYQYRFTLNGNKVMVGAEKDNNVINVGSSRLFKEMSKLIVSFINTSGIFDEGKFTTTFHVGTQDYQVILTPKQKEMKRMFHSMTLTFNKTDYTVNTVEIKEVSDDVTLITMKNKQINVELDDEIFAIR